MKDLKYKNQNNTPDDILIPVALFDNKKLSYVLKSFNVFKPDFLYKNGASAIFGPGTVIPVAAEKMLKELFNRL